MTQNTYPATTPAYWDCDCAVDYIHSALSDACLICGSHRDESPDAHIDELDPEVLMPDFHVQETDHEQA